MTLSAINTAIGNGLNALGNGAHETINLLGNPARQQQVEQGFRDGVTTAYSAMSRATNIAVAKMEGEGIDTLSAPISKMSDLQINRLNITEEMSSNSQSLRKAANKMIGYHQAVVIKGEEYSRAAGKTAHSLTRFALTPIRFAFRLLNLESAGAMIQNAVALAVGFAVRGITLVASQIVGHVLPYAAVGAALYGVGSAFAALAVASPVAAVAVGLGGILAGQQAQILSLSAKNDKLLRNQRRQSRQLDAIQNAPSVFSRISEKAPSAKTVAAAAMIGMLATAAYYYGPDALETVSESDTYKAAGETLKGAREFVQGVSVDSVLNEGAYRANQVSNAAKSILGYAKPEYTEEMTKSRAFLGALKHNGGIASKAAASVMGY